MDVVALLSCAPSFLSSISFSLLSSLLSLPFVFSSLLFIYLSSLCVSLSLLFLSLSVAAASLALQALWDQRWTAEAFDNGFGSAHACTGRRQPPAETGWPLDISDHLLDLQAYMTAAFRFGRGGCLWCGRNVVQWQSCEKKKARDPYEAFKIDSSVF